MERNKRMRALILSVRELGENNRSVQVLSAEEGIFHAVLYGGPKSRLKSLVQPFNSGTIWIYSDETKNSRKIVDFDAKFCRLSLRSSLFKAFAASLGAELAIKTKCAGDSENTFILLSALLDGMEVSSENESRLGLLRFLWRYTGLLGLQPEVHKCLSCGSSLLSATEMNWFIPNQNGFVCNDCIPWTKDHEMKIECDVHALTYLAAINELPPAQVRSLLLPPASVSRLRHFVYFLAEKASETKLDTLESGYGIL